MTSTGDSGGPRSAGADGAVRVLPLRAEHLDAVLEIEARTSPAGWSRNIFLTELGQPETRCYVVAEDAERGIVGFAGVQIMVDEAHVTTIAVAPEQRRRGIATRMLVALLHAARARGARAATLEVRLHNSAARGLYAGFGFRPVGIRPRYYEGKVDALIMWAHDIDGPEYGRLLAERTAERAAGPTASPMTPDRPAEPGGRPPHRRGPGERPRRREPAAASAGRREPGRSSAGRRQQDAAVKVSPRTHGEH